MGWDTEEHTGAGRYQTSDYSYGGLSGGGGVLLPGEQNLAQLHGWRPVAYQKGYGDRSLAGCLSVLYSLRGHTVGCIKIGAHVRDAGGRVRSAGLRA